MEWNMLNIKRDEKSIEINWRVRMKKSLLILLIIFLTLVINAEVIEINGNRLSVNVISSNEASSELELELGSFNREAVIIDGETWWRVGLDGESRRNEAGSPEVARIVRNLAISDAGLMEVNVISSEYVEYEMNIAPSRGIMSRSIDPSTVPFEFGAQYNEDTFYPESIVRLQTPYIFRDVRGLAVNIMPMQYNPVSGILRVYTNVTLSVVNSGIDTVNIKEIHNTMRPEFAKIYERKFINWNEYITATRYNQISETAGRMIVISYPDFMDAMQPFVDWKNAKGIPTTLEDVSVIGNNSTSIQNFITSEYEAGDGLVWVLLVGDALQVATKTYSNAGGDPQYTYLEGNDNYSEIFIGRFSAESEAQVETQVERTIYYERDVVDGDWMQKGVGIASSQGTGQGHYDEADYVHIGYIRDDLLDYGYLEVDEIYDTNGGNATMVANALNEGRGIINYCGHGSNTTWVSTGFSNSHVNALTNDYMLPLINSVACVNGNFTSRTCFAEAWMRATNGDAPTGATAIFASSINQSWDPPMYAQDESIDLMCAEELNTLGGLWFNGVSYMLDESGDNAMAKTWHIFGDPSLQVRTMIPLAMEIEHFPTAFIGLSDFEVSTDTPEAMYCLSYEGMIIDNGYADENGDFVIDMTNSPAMPADLDLTITAYNRISSEEVIQLLPNVGPYILLHSFDINSNGDDVIDAGDTVEISLNIENLGSEQATNTVVSIAIDDEYITITDGEEVLGDVASEVLLNLEDIFSFNVSDEINFGHPFEVTVTMSCDEAEWSEVYMLASYAPPGLWITLGDLSFEIMRGYSGTDQIEISNYRNEPVFYSLRTEAVTGRSVVGSLVTCNTHHFEPGEIITWTFSVTNNSLDNEWIEGLMISFPDGVNITGATDFVGGSGGPLEWDGISGDGVNVNWYGETQNGNGRLRDGETATCDIDVEINPGFTGEMTLEWRLNGDGYGEEPHDLFGEIEMLFPLSWIMLSEIEGELGYGEASIIDVTINTEEMEIGMHECEIVITDNRLETRIPVTVEVIDLIENDENEVSSAVELIGNYPNPFNPVTEIMFNMQHAGIVNLTIYNVRGQIVKTLISENQEAGEHTVSWRGRDDSGTPVSSGVYFYKFSTSDYATTKKMVLMK